MKKNILLLFVFGSVLSSFSPRYAKTDIYSKTYIKSIMKRVADWQLANPVALNDKNENDWARSAFYAGVIETYKTTQDEKYLDAAVAWASGFHWKLAKRLRHADDQARGQTYLEIFNIKKDPEMIRDTRRTFDSLILDPKPGRVDWWWCDALFMAPPVLTRLYAATGDKRYLDFLDTMFWDTYDFLYDKEEHLFYRDKSYFEKRTPNGRKTFWARGNGWVMGGTVRVLQYLPKDHPSWPKYAGLLNEMAGAIKKVQGSDGLWRPSLLDAGEVPHPETSGSAFYCYALSWGINNGLLDRKEYLPVIRNAWRGLNDYVTKEGKLQWVQPIGQSPEKVTIDNFQEYASGAFLLAGSEMIKIEAKR